MAIDDADEVSWVPLCKDLTKPNYGLVSRLVSYACVVTYRENIFECRLEQIPELVLCRELEYRRLEWVGASARTEELHPRRGCSRRATSVFHVLRVSASASSGSMHATDQLIW